MICFELTTHYVRIVPMYVHIYTKYGTQLHAYVIFTSVRNFRWVGIGIEFSQRPGSGSGSLGFKSLGSGSRSNTNIYHQMKTANLVFRGTLHSVRRFKY